MHKIKYIGLQRKPIISKYTYQNTKKQIYYIVMCVLLY
jgi:hypothetical protein